MKMEDLIIFRSGLLASTEMSKGGRTHLITVLFYCPTEKYRFHLNQLQGLYLSQSTRSAFNTVLCDFSNNKIQSPYSDLSNLAKVLRSNWDIDIIGVSAGDMYNVIWGFTEAIFLYCCSDYPSCSANAIQMGWATWTIWTVVKKYNLRALWALNMMEVGK